MFSNRTTICSAIASALVLIILSSEVVNAAQRTVLGKIKHSDGSPAENARVRIIDVDPGEDDLMGEVRTDTNGDYSFQWPEGKIWDPPKSDRHTQWRPDLQIKVKWSAEDDNQWDAEGQSEVRENCRHDRSHRFDLTLKPITRTINGVIRDKDGVVQQLRVRAWDKDQVTDERMGKDAFTDANGRYSITYEGRAWDARIPGSTSWRPDIYLTVAVERENGSWSRQYVSTPINDHPLRDPLTIDITLTGKCGLGEPVNCSCPQLANFVAPHANLSNVLFTPACVRHDYCYRHGNLTYNKSKKECDNDFLADMQTICLKPTNIVVLPGVCQTWATEYFAAVVAAGGSSYRPNGMKCEYE
jgi:hypothetical protein